MATESDKKRKPEKSKFTSVEMKKVERKMQTKKTNIQNDDRSNLTEIKKPTTEVTKKKKIKKVPSSNTLADDLMQKLMPALSSSTEDCNQNADNITHGKSAIDGTEIEKPPPTEASRQTDEQNDLEEQKNPQIRKVKPVHAIRVKEHTVLCDDALLKRLSDEVGFQDPSLTKSEDEYPSLKKSKQNPSLLKSDVSGHLLKKSDRDSAAVKSEDKEDASPKQAERPQALKQSLGKEDVLLKQAEPSLSNVEIETSHPERGTCEKNDSPVEVEANSVATTSDSLSHIDESAIPLRSRDFSSPIGGTQKTLIGSTLASSTLFVSSLEESESRRSKSGNRTNECTPNRKSTKSSVSDVIVSESRSDVGSSTATKPAVDEHMAKISGENPIKRNRLDVKGEANVSTENSEWGENEEKSASEISTLQFVDLNEFDYPENQQVAKGNNVFVEDPNTNVKYYSLLNGLIRNRKLGSLGEDVCHCCGFRKNKETNEASNKVKKNENFQRKTTPVAFGRFRVDG